MAKINIQKASTDVTVYVFIQDSSKTDGSGLTGLVFNSAGLTCYYVRPLGAAAQLTLATQTVTGAHSDGGFVEVDATNLPGFYRLDLSDAICATGVNSVALMLKGATNMAPLPLEIQLVSYNPNDVVRLGLTALPNAAADAAGGLPISDAGGLDLDTILDVAISTRLAPTVAARTLDVTAAGTAGIDWANIENPTTAQNLSSTNINPDQVVASVAGAVGSVTGNVGGNVVGSVGSVTAGVTLAASAVQAIWDALTSALTTVGSIGKLLVDNVNATISSRAAQTTADAIETDTQDIQSRLPAALTGGKMESNIGSITAGVIAAASFAAGAFDAVWTVGTRTLTSFGTLTTDTAAAVWAAATRTLTAFDASFKTGYALSAAGVQAIWDALTAALTTVGSVGKLIVDNLNATVASRATQADILSDATPFAGANVDAAVSTRATPTQVNAEVLDVLNVDTFAEPTGVPPATSTLVQKIGRLYMALRNGLTVTATDKTFLDDGGAGEWKKPLSDDGTTYTEGEGTTP